ncbi:MAG: hypothetical protein ACT4OT_17300 [Acidobacteriota bacterium]
MLSLVSVAFNSLVISYISERLKNVDDEHTSLLDSLERQTAALSEGDSQFDHFRIMHNLALVVPPAKTTDARRDAESFLKTFLTKYYAAANDIPPTEITSLEVEEAGQAIPLLEKALELAQVLQTTTDPVARARLTAELENLSKQMPEPKSELGKKLREIQKYSQAEYAENDLMLYAALLPVMKSLREQIVTSIEKKRVRIRDLQRERASLVKKSNYATYGAIAFQLLGLACILAQDLLSQRES